VSGTVFARSQISESGPGDRRFKSFLPNHSLLHRKLKTISNAEPTRVKVRPRLSG
jgi:hypothetical protein